MIEMSSEEGEGTSSLQTTAVVAETETTAENAMKNIFSACDTENNGIVLTSKLIEYISPFMGCNVTELMQLKEMLDPENENVAVEKDRFYAVMSEWVGLISNAANNRSDENFYETNNPSGFYKIEEEDFPLMQSTPRSSLGHQFLKRYAEFGITNIFSFSECSETNSTAAPDKTLFEEQMKELTHQNRKLTEELTHAKAQLISNEELIDNLQANLDNVARRLTSEQQTIEQLQKMINEADNTSDDCNDILLQYNELKKQKAALEKDYLALQDNFDALDNEKADLMRQVEEYTKKEREWDEKLVALNREVNISDEKITGLEDVIARLKIEMEELKNMGKSYKQRSEELVAENQTLEKLLHKIQLQQNLTTSLNRPCHPRNSCCSPSGILSNSLQNANTSLNFSFENLRHSYIFLNSPKLVKQLNNPLSPLFNTPEEKHGDVSPNFTSVIKSSTPVLQAMTLLDDSIPPEFKKISVLSPNKLEPIMGTDKNKTESSPAICITGDETCERQKESIILQGNNTSEEDYWKINHMQILGRQSPHESLHEEISEVDGNCGKECIHLIQLTEIKSAYQDLQNELFDLEKLKKENVEYRKEIEQLSLKINELNSNLSTNKSDSGNSELNNSTTYVTELRVHLDEEAEDVGSLGAGDASKLDALEKENQDLLLIIENLKQDYDQLFKCSHERQLQFETLAANFMQITTQQKEVKNELQVLLTENNSLKETLDKSSDIQQKFEELCQQYSLDKIEWNKQKEEFLNQIADSSQELEVLRQKLLEKSETSSEISDTCNSNDDFIRDRKDKTILSFSRMRMKVDKLEEKIEHLEEQLRNERTKKEELQLIARRAEENYNAVNMERNQLKLKLDKTDAALQNTETEIFSLESKLKSLSENTFKLKGIESSVRDAVHQIYESNVELLSFLEDTVSWSTAENVLQSFLNSWNNSLDVFDLNSKDGEQSSDVIIKALIIHTENLRRMVHFNEQFSESLKVFIREKYQTTLNSEVTKKGFIIKRPNKASLCPESPDSPSLNDIPESTVPETHDRSLPFDSYREHDVDLLVSGLEDTAISYAFPNLPGVLLEYLNIIEDSSWETISDKEIEEKYTTLMTAFTTDSLSIRQRLENNNIQLIEFKKSFLISLRELGQNFTTLKQLSQIAKAFYKVCAIAEAYGALQEEFKIHKCITLIKCHVLTLKNKLKVPILQSSSKQNSSKTMTKGFCDWLFYGICTIILLIVITAISNTCTHMAYSGDGIRQFFYTLRDLSWEELLTPTWKARYCVDDCPY